MYRVKRSIHGFSQELWKSKNALATCCETMAFVGILSDTPGSSPAAITQRYSGKRGINVFAVHLDLLNV